MVPDLNPSIELDEAAQTIQNMITRNRLLPVHLGYSEVEWSELNDSLLFRHHIERCLAYVEAGAFRLPLGVQADNQKWVTCNDRLSGR